MKTLFIYNPHAGMMQIKSHLYNILNIFASAEYDLTVYPTKKSGEIAEYLKNNALKFDLIVCSGGDGTLNETINGLLSLNSEKLPPLGYIPAGSTNDYASSIKIPKVMEKAAELIVNGKVQSYDVGKLNSKYFIYVAAFGAFTRVSYDTPQDVKNVFGHLAYLVEGVKSLSEIKAQKIKVKLDDTVVEGNFIFGMITNTLQVGGVYKLNPKEVSLDDGLLEVMLVKEPKDVVEFNEIASFLLGGIKNSSLVLTFKAHNIIIESKESIPWTIDGEYGGSYNRTIIQDKQKAINIISK